MTISKTFSGKYRVRAKYKGSVRSAIFSTIAEAERWKARALEDMEAGIELERPITALDIARHFKKVHPNQYAARHRYWA